MDSRDKPQSPNPLDLVLKEVVQNVFDENLRTWRGWLRRQNEMGEELRRRFDACQFTEDQVAVIWLLLFSCSDYQLSILMDFIERCADSNRLKITVDLASLLPDIPQAPGISPYDLSSAELLSYRYGGASERHSQVSMNWAEEKLKEIEKRR
jgi:hypothetical protein